MKSLFAKAGFALALSATALTVAAPAEAQRYRGGYRGHDNTGTAIVAGVAGLAVGAALASSANRDRYYYDDGYYDGGYYGPAYAPAYYGPSYYDDGYYRAPPRVYYDRRVYRGYDRGYRGYRGGYGGGYGRGGYGGGGHGRGGYGGGYHR